MNRFLADENLPLPVVAELRSLGHDVMTLQETGKGNQQFIVCSMDIDYPGQAHRIHQAVKSCVSLAGLLVRVNRPA